MCSEYYKRGFFRQIRSGSRQSAEVIVPLVLQLLSVRSVVDVGCGDGTWLSVFRKLGIDDVLGIDGEYVDRDLLQIPQDRFQAADLTEPFRLTRVFDLAMSLEVAEHLPTECAPTFVQSLTSLAPAVLFSAAIPFQGGNHHVNEQWPDKWAALFLKHDYRPVDSVRKQVWENEAVKWWYAQNTLLFAHENLLERNRGLKFAYERTDTCQLCLVHPRMYLEVVTSTRPNKPGLKGASRFLLKCVKNAVREKLDSIMGRQG